METRKKLESLYVQQTNQPQAYIETEGKEEVEVMQAIETTLTNRQYSHQVNKNKFKKTWRWWHEKKLTHMNI